MNNHLRHEFRSELLNAEVIAESPIARSIAYAGLIDLAIAINAEAARQHRALSKAARKYPDRHYEADTWQESASGLDGARQMLKAERQRLGARRDRKKRS